MSIGPANWSMMSRAERDAAYDNGKAVADSDALRLVGRRALGGHGARPSTVKAGLALSGVYELAPIRDTHLNGKLNLNDKEIEMLSPLRLPAVPKPLAIAHGTAELPPFVADSRSLHARRAAAHQPGALLPIAGANHFAILDELRVRAGQLTRLALELVR